MARAMTKDDRAPLSLLLLAATVTAAVVLNLACSTAPEAPVAPATDGGLTADLDRGREVFAVACAGCHGYDGNGEGAVAGLLAPRPRNFLSGRFKFRSTPSGTMPLETDLVRTISDGLHGTSMPPFAAMTREDMLSVIAWVRKLYRDNFLAELIQEEYGDEEPDPEGLEELRDIVAARLESEQPIEIPAEPMTDDASIQRGRDLYYRMGCHECHGRSGRGDGSSSATLKDDWGNPIRPADFTLPMGIKTGQDPRMIYRTFMTGLDGTPMPSFNGQITPEEAWDLTHYVLRLRRSPRR